MERRMFIKSLTAGLAAIPFLPRTSQALSEELQALADMVQGTPDKRQLWRQVRKEFLLNSGLAHLNCGTVGSSPRVVLEAVSRFMYELEGDPVHNAWGGIGRFCRLRRSTKIWWRWCRGMSC